jgi:hypothetical protein
MGANNDENQWWDFYVINVDLSYFLGKLLCYFAYTLFLRYSTLFFTLFWESYKYFHQLFTLDALVRVITITKAGIIKGLLLDIFSPLYQLKLCKNGFDPISIKKKFQK